MSDALIATLGGVCALVFWGLGDWLVARTSKKNDAVEVNAAFQLPGFAIIMSLIWLTHQHVNSWHNILVLSIAGLVFTAAFVIFIKALATGALGIVAPVASTFPLFTLILSAIFFTLNSSHLQLLAMVVVVLGVIILAYEKRNRAVSLRVQHQATIWALLAAVLWGIGNVMQNSVITDESWEIILGAINVSMLIYGILLLFTGPPAGWSRKVKRSLSNRITLTAGAIYTIGSFGFYYSSVRVGSVLIPVIVGSASPLVTSALGAYFDQERLTLIKRAGAVVAVAGIILINI
ncbi:MAG TPA: DMT family transporter [Candidatus Saccharimonadales bacterium]|nr:DMT family transporter [Candidatus Saccharimonadales bacterium]